MFYELNGLRWFAVSVLPNREKTVACILERKGYEEFLPMWLPETTASRRQPRSLPLFPGYVFCRLNLADRSHVMVTTPGVIRLLSIGGTPCPIPDCEIWNLQTIVSSGLPAEPWAEPAVGDKLQIATGPLAGIEGIVWRMKGRDKLIVGVSLLQRWVAVELGRSDVNLRGASGTEGLLATWARQKRLQRYEAAQGV